MKKEFTIGEYRNIDEYKDKIKLYINIPHAEVKDYWNRCGLTSNFIASYIALSYSDEKNITNSLSFIINELLENSIKYSSESDKGVEICFLQKDETVIIEISNDICKEQMKKMKCIAENIVNGDCVNDKYLDIISANAKLSNGSGVGLLTIISYYNVVVGFKFIAVDEFNEAFRLSVQVRINVEEL